MSPHTKRKEKRVLLVEDEPSYRTSLMSVLRRAGIQCTFSVDGDNALKRLAQEKFDLMIVDYLIPGPNGVEIVKWARKHSIDIPALLVTNYPSDELNEHAKLLGNTKVLPKPSYNMASIQKLIEDLLA
jgi:CheY-like chemotaxis protein